MNKLNRLYFSQNISIDNALSMNQILHQIVNQIKEIVDFINNLELRANEYTDQEIEKLNNALQSQLATLEQTLKTYTSDSIDTYNAEVINPQLIEIRNTIDTLNQTLNERIDDEVGVLNRRISSVESTLNKKIDDTKEYLEDLIRKGNQLVYSSISGRKIPIQDTLFEIGNTLKQTLSYNWNSLNVLKILDIFVDDLINMGYTLQYEDYLYYKEIYRTGYMTYNSSIAEYDGHDCIRISWSGPPQSFFTDVVVNDISIMESVYFNQSNIYIPISELHYPFSNLKIIADASDRDGVVLDYNYFNFLDSSESDELSINAKITYNSLKTAMLFLNVNWNAILYTGVNTFYELNKSNKLYDVNNLYNMIFFNDTNYKTIHNNFDSDFFKSNINNEGE